MTNLNRDLSKKLVLRGKRAYEKDKDRDAVKYYKKALKLYPNNHQAYQGLADAYEAIEKIPEAIQSYQKLNQMKPNAYLPYQSVCRLLIEQGRLAEAVKACKTALALKPDSYETQMLLGEIYLEKGQLRRVQGLYRDLIKRYPRKEEAYIELACILDNAQKYTEANRLFLTGIRLKPREAQNHLLYGISLMTQKKWQAAIPVFMKLTKLDPKESDHYHMLATCYAELGELKLAKKYFKRASKQGSTQSDYQLELLSGKPLKTLPKGDVKGIFNEYAKSFDHELVNVLRYRVPEQIYALVQKIYPTHHFKNALDLGCGTGLLGEAFRNKVDTIRGVDLSTSMLKKAEKKGIYKQLYQKDILEFLKSCRLKFDLILSSDVFIYIGELDLLFKHLDKVLLPYAHLVFSTEDHPGDSLVLQPSGRYAHSVKYIQQLAKLHNYDVLSKKLVNVRKEYHQWIKGRIFVLKKRK